MTGYLQSKLGELWYYSNKKIIEETDMRLVRRDEPGWAFKGQAPTAPFRTHMQGPSSGTAPLLLVS
jgi:hypothetical protein